LSDFEANFDTPDIVRGRGLAVFALAGDLGAVCVKPVIKKTKIKERRKIFFILYVMNHAGHPQKFISERQVTGHDFNRAGRNVTLPLSALP
jgi:hypothetical protein